MPTCWAGVVVRPDELQAGRVTAFVGAPVLITAIVGPNACGKSTLLRVLSRLLTPSAGQVVLDGRAIASYPSRHVARRLALLPQSSIAPDGITVTDLVGRGRFPYQSALRQSRDDEQAVNEAIAITGIADLADRLVDELSGGQRQRVWVAMVLAQQTPLMLLDEPTTGLDSGSAAVVVEHLRHLAGAGTTVVAATHDAAVISAADHRIELDTPR